jgi:hypothetical protein
MQQILDKRIVLKEVCNMGKEINIERNNKYHLLIDELEEIKELIEIQKDQNVLINKELLLSILNESIDDYWRAKEEGERH